MLSGGSWGALGTTFGLLGGPVLCSFGFEIFKGRHGRLRMADVELSGLSGRSGGALGSPRGALGGLLGSFRGTLRREATTGTFDY